MKDLLIDYLVGTAVAFTPLVVLNFVSRHAGLWTRLRKWRNWAKGPGSWAPCVMIPLMLTMLSIVVIAGHYWGVYVSAIVLIAYTHFSLPGVLNLKIVPILLPSVTISARVSLVPAPTMDVHGIKIPNHKYLKFKWAEYRKKL